jgi:hypothetical protein
MNGTANTGFDVGPQTAHPSCCTRQQARELLEGLRRLYQSILPAERIVFRSIVNQAARKQLAREMNAEVSKTVRIG